MLRLFSRRPNLKAAIDSLERYGIPVERRVGFATFLEEAHERALYHFNPRYLAEHLNLSERATLKLLMVALYEGIVSMHWDIQCPMCGATDHRSSSLAHLHRDMHCADCDSHFAPHLDEEVRVTFSPHRRFRVLSPAADAPAFRAEIDARLGVVSGLALLVLPEFQRMFPQQRLLPDESLDVTRVVLLFSDLAGSTVLYARRGDPRAYHLVRLHFDELFRATDNYSGTVVKTIGDAILAAFQNPIEAVRAAMEMQHAIQSLNERMRLTDDERLILKIGLHAGPCLSVTLNEHPDYFGTTVNIAARVQSLSHGRDVVLTESLRADNAVQHLLNGYEIESSRIALRGIGQDVLIHRVDVSNEKALMAAAGRFMPATGA